MENSIKEFLEKNKINYVLHKHKAVFTCAEADIHCKNVPGEGCKNLFIKDKKSRHFFLVAMLGKKKLDMKLLGAKLGFSQIKFANENELLEILNLKPGSVSVLGLLNDKEKKVRLIVDQSVWDVEIVSFHPNINTESLEFKKEDFHKLAKALDSNLEIIHIF